MLSLLDEFFSPGINKLSACYQPAHHCGHCSRLSDKSICSQTIFFQPGHFLPWLLTQCSWDGSTSCLCSLWHQANSSGAQNILLSALTAPTVPSLRLPGTPPPLPSKPSSAAPPSHSPGWHWQACLPALWCKASTPTNIPTSPLKSFLWCQTLFCMFYTKTTLLVSAFLLLTCR